MDFPLLALFSAVVLLAWIGARLTEGSPGAPWFDNLHWTVATAGGAFLAWRASQSSAPGTAGHRLRQGTAWALTVYAVGQLFWDVETALGWSLVPGVSDLFYLAMGPLMSWALRRSWSFRPGARNISGIHLDSTLMTLGIMVLSFASYLPFQAEWTWFQLAVMVAYPATLFGAFSLGLVLALHDSGPFHPGRVVTLGALFGTSFSWMAWNLATLAGNTPDGTWLNLSFSVCALALGGSIGTWSWSRRTCSHGWKARVLVLLPLVGPVAGALGFLVAVTDPLMPVFYRSVFGVLALVLLVLSMVRQWALFRELEEAQTQRQRNTELEDALAELRRTQDQLVQTAKLTALGQLIAGITHDLNSPLGAIRSSSALLQTVLREQADTSHRLLAGLDAPQHELYRQLSHALSPELPFLDSRTERSFKRSLTEAAAARGHAHPEALASALVEAGLAERTDLVASLFALAEPEGVVKALEAQATAHRLAAVIHQATDRVSKVVVSLHNFLRTGDEGERRLVVVAESVREVLPLFQHWMRHGLELTTAFEGEALVLAWPDKLSQVWVNLITNAVQAVGTGGAVEVGIRVEGAQVAVRVTDNGPGIPAEVKDRIFDAFFTTKGVGEGTGLGLEVCRRVVEELGGTISVESQPGRTVFEVRLPLA